MQRLALGPVPVAALASERPWTEADPTLTLLPDEDAARFRVRRTLGASDWTPYERFPGVWWIERSFLGNVDAERDGLRVEADGHELRHAPWRGMRISREALEPGYFGLAGRRLVVTLAPEASASAHTLVDETVELGTSAGGANRIALGPLAGDGFVVAPGFPARIPCALDDPRVLRFAAVLSAASGRTATLIVRHDGATLAELPLVADAAPRAFEVALDAAPGTHTLELALAGGSALCGVFAPTLGPAAPPPRAARAADPRASLVLFVADTFRADNLALHGGRPEIAPEVARFAAESAWFETAWASASWTLPAHAAMLAAVHPPQARVVSNGDRLSDEALTLAELLAAAGWRTGAVTDGGFVSAVYGLDQGFEWFDGRRKSPDETLAAVREFLARDDGRPVFLLVHSYRAHHPYVPDPEASRATLDALGVRPDVEAADLAARPTDVVGWQDGWTPTEDEARRMRDYQALYRAASNALDRLFGETRAALGEHLDPAHTFLVFTSDHGEAFWEHGAAEHGTGVWEELLRIPLVVRGPGIAPGARALRASSIDLPRTLAGLVGVAPSDGWSGVDLFRAATNGPLLAFQCALNDAPSSFALLDGRRKLIASEHGGTPAVELQHAFDLATDPGERVELRAEPWARVLRSEGSELVERAFLPLLAPVASAPGAVTLEDLRALGYAGDD